jgi:hypothetical protein
MEDTDMDVQDPFQAAEKYKNKGNDQFKMKNFTKAIELYTQAIGKYIIINSNFNMFRN